MKLGTRTIIERVSKSKAAPITREQWSEFVDDVLAMGRDEFLKMLFAPKASKAAKKARPEPDALLQQAERYRKKSGLSSRDFVSELHTRLAPKLQQALPKTTLSSASKYLAFARRSISDADIEAACAAVTDAFA
jgi:hypothetical protein